jgi:site-specific DNA-methyltransferase (adenine-specific)
LLNVNRIYNGDCLELMKQIENKSINMIFCDLPYGVTSRNKWDSVIPPNLLWKQYERIITDNGAILLFGQDKFTAKMMLSNEKLHRYNIIWKKTTPTGFLNAKKMPLRIHEDIMVFYKKLPIYNPQKTAGHNPVHNYIKHTTDGNDYGKTKLGISGGGSTERYPTSVWEFLTDKQKCSYHPTQKPIELCRYAIRTYTNKNDIVLDNCCGSGSIPLAAYIEGRNYIGIDNGICEKENSKYYGWYWADVSTDRINTYEENNEFL